MPEDFITTRILKSQRERIGKITGNPPSMGVEEYVQAALNERLNKDEKKRGV